MPPTAVVKAQTGPTGLIRRMINMSSSPQIRAYLTDSSGEEAVFLNREAAMSYAVKRRGRVELLVSLADYCKLEAELLATLDKLGSREPTGKAGGVN